MGDEVRGPRPTPDIGPTVLVVAVHAVFLLGLMALLFFEVPRFREVYSGEWAHIYEIPLVEGL